MIILFQITCWQQEYCSVLGANGVAYNITCNYLFGNRNFIQQKWIFCTVIYHICYNITVKSKWNRSKIDKICSQTQPEHEVALGALFNNIHEKQVGLIIKYIFICRVIPGVYILHQNHFPPNLYINMCRKTDFWIFPNPPWPGQGLEPNLPVSKRTCYWDWCMLY